jgi:putative transposase
MAISNAVIDEMIKGYKNPEDIIGPDGLLKQLTKAIVERMLEAEMDHHLGYDKHSAKGNNTGNSRNGHSSKSVITDTGVIDLAVPRDRNGEFSPMVVEKGQRRFTGFDEKIISMYGFGTSTRDIALHLKEIYGADVSPDLISRVTDGIREEVDTWQKRPLLPVYSIVYFDALWVKVREDNRVINKAVYVALGVDLDGKKDVLGLWIDSSEGARFWMKVIGEIQNRGVNDILIACVDGLKGFPEAIEAVFPLTQVQVCIVHMIRNSFQFVPRKNSKEFMSDLKEIYQAPSEAAGLQALDSFSTKWKGTYPTVVKSWQNNWTRLSVMLNYPEAIRKLIYTTNPIESLNASLRKVTKNKRMFPNDDAVFKQLYLAVTRRVESWKGGILGWREIRNQLNIIFEGRV